MAPSKNLRSVLFGDGTGSQPNHQPQGINGSISNSKARRIVPASLFRGSPQNQCRSWFCGIKAQRERQSMPHLQPHQGRRLPHRIAELVLCHYGSSHHPPEGLRPGDTHTGGDGQQWAYTKDTSDGRA
jgi:hypothetical protein